MLRSIISSHSDFQMASKHPFYVLKKVLLFVMISPKSFILN